MQRREDVGKKLVAELRKLGVEAEFIRSDVRHEEDLRSLVDKTVALWSSGFCYQLRWDGRHTRPADEPDYRNLCSDLRHNRPGYAAQHEARNARDVARGSGSIVNVSSTYGRTGASASIYAASKHAVEGLTKSAALEAASSGVRVNMVGPRSNRDWDAEPLHRY